MKLHCDRLRDGLTAEPDAALPGEWRDHIDGCPSCARYRARLLATREFLRARRAEFEPDPSFAARVAAQLASSRDDALGWAALRLLPVTLALALALGWFALRTEPVQQVAEVAAPTEDLVSWVLESTETDR